MAQLLAMGFLAGVVVACGSQPAITEELVNTVNSLQSSWIAHKSPRFANASQDDLTKLCGTILRSDPRYHDALPPKPAAALLGDAPVPAEFDVRTNWPKCASVSGNIRDQSSCGSCWAFASTEAFNDRRCIVTGDTTILSPTDTLGNCGLFQCQSNGCGGGQPGAAWAWFTRVGVVTGGDYSDIGKGDTCAPYPFAPCAHHVDPTPQLPKCGPEGEYKTPEIHSSCTESAYPKSYASDKKKASSSYSLTSVEQIQQDMMQHGSATAAFTVYADFPAYKSGVYKHTTGAALGGHAVKLLGWGVESGQDYWLVANSWNNQWGDHGTFKIARGNNECGIEDQVSAGLAESSDASIVV